MGEGQVSRQILRRQSHQHSEKYSSLITIPRQQSYHWAILLFVKAKKEIGSSKYKLRGLGGGQLCRAEELKGKMCNCSHTTPRKVKNKIKLLSAATALPSLRMDFPELKNNNFLKNSFLSMPFITGSPGFPRGLQLINLKRSKAP